MSHRQYVNLPSWKHLASLEPLSDYIAYNLDLSLVMSFNFGTSLAMYGRLRAENNYVTQTNRHIHKCIYRYVMLLLLQTVIISIYVYIYI